MRIKSLQKPSHAEKEGTVWISPDGVSPPWIRVWNGTEWQNSGEDESEEKEDLEENEDMEGNDPPTEESNDEQGMQTEVSDSNRGEQGASGEPIPKPQQRGKRGKVLKRGKGK